MRRPGHYRLPVLLAAAAAVVVALIQLLRADAGTVTLCIRAVPDEALGSHMIGVPLRLAPWRGSGCKA